MEKDVWHVFKYCPRCGSPLSLIKNEDGPALRCSADGHIYYQNPQAAVAAVITDKVGQFLFIKRDKEPKKNMWDLPGGFVNWGEDPNRAIIREVREELNIKFIPNRVLTVAHDWYPFDGLMVSVNSMVFEGTFSGRTRTNSEIQSLRWFDKSELPISNVAFPCVRQAIKIIRSQ